MRRRTIQIPTASSQKNPRYPVTPWSSMRLYRPYVRASLAVALTLGFTTGAAMLLLSALNVDRGLWWITHAQAHGMAQLFGFAGLFVMGIAYHVVPRFRNSSIRFPWPQRASLTLVLTAIVLRFTGQSVDLYPATGVLLIASGLLLLFGALIFAATMLTTLRTGNNPYGSAERWVLAGTIWVVIASSIHLVLTIWLVSNEALIAPLYLNSAVIYAALFGFVGSFIMGVSTRAVAGFLGLRPLHRRLELSAFVLLQGGLLLAVFSYVLEAPADISALGMLLMSIGVVLFIAALRVLEPSSTRRAPLSPGAFVRYGWFIRGAYFWLLVGVTLIGTESVEILSDTTVLPDEYTSPILHVLTVGFVTSMIIGMGSRMLPLFEGAVVPGRRMLDVSMVLLSVSVLIRTVAGFTFEGFTDAALGISGFAGLIAVVLSIPALTGSMRESARMKYTALAKEQGRVKWRGAAQTTTDHQVNS